MAYKQDIHNIAQTSSLVPDHFYHSRRNPVPTPHSPHCLATTNLFSASLFSPLFLLGFPLLCVGKLRVILQAP